jgi:hypothetical protein
VCPFQHVALICRSNKLFRKSETVLYHIHPALTMEGVSRSPRCVVRDAMDALISQASDIDTYGQAVWSCPANAGDKLRNDPRSDGGNQAGSPGRSRSSRKTIAQGVPE